MGGITNGHPGKAGNARRRATQLPAAGRQRTRWAPGPAWEPRGARRTRARLLHLHRETGGRPRGQREQVLGAKDQMFLLPERRLASWRPDPNVCPSRALELFLRAIPAPDLPPPPQPPCPPPEWWRRFYTQESPCLPRGSPTICRSLLMTSSNGQARTLGLPAGAWVLGCLGACPPRRHG